MNETLKAAAGAREQLLLRLLKESLPHVSSANSNSTFTADGARHAQKLAKRIRAALEAPEEGPRPDSRAGEAAAFVVRPQHVHEELRDGPVADPAWLITFQEPEVPVELFFMPADGAGARTAALERFEQVRHSYSCSLFVEVAVDPPRGGELGYLKQTRGR